MKTRFESDYEANIQILAGLADLRGPVSPGGTVTITSVRFIRLKRVRRTLTLFREQRSCTMKCLSSAALRSLQTVCILWISPATPNKLMARFKL